VSSRATEAPAPSVGRKAHGRRAFDLLIAAIALGAVLPLYTRNANDFDQLEALIDVHLV
jgi:predicted nucleic acid-binding protein